MAYTRRPRRRSGGGRRGKQLVVYGAVIFAFGLVITLGTYSWAESRDGGSYFISYGPMIAGVICMVRGAFQAMSDRRSGASQPVGQPAGQEVPGPGYGARPEVQTGAGNETGDSSGRPSYDQPGYAMPRTAAAEAPGARPAAAQAPAAQTPDARVPDPQASSAPAPA
ncbi:MAG: hypothetical protein J2P26_02140, partial [Nocardiopsaceae bacterium]|nr:hypothetical protein [Nocardiopsaceae bacterium]